MDCLRQFKQGQTVLGVLGVQRNRMVLGLGNRLSPAKRKGFGGKGAVNQMAARERRNHSMDYLNHQG